ncbi:unnamed protein product, partial [Prorocentrum cordatum]
DRVFPRHGHGVHRGQRRAGAAQGEQPEAAVDARGDAAAAEAGGGGRRGGRGRRGRG